jgi:hypothetical protein
MADKYNCICGYKTDEVNEFRAHLLHQSRKDGKGTHISLHATQGETLGIETSQKSQGDLSFIGLSPRMVKELEAVGINTINDLTERSEQVLKTIALVREAAKAEQTIELPAEQKQEPVPQIKEAQVVEQVKSTERLAEFEKNLVAVANARTEPKVEPTPIPIPNSTPTAPEVKSKNPSRRWWLILLGIISVVIGCGISYYGNNLGNSILIVAGLAGIVPGGFLFFKGWQKPQARVIVNVGGGKIVAKPTGKENCINIYPREMGGIRFEYLEETPPGLPRQLVNNGKNYLVNIWNPAEQKLVHFIPPDQKYYDPRVLAEVVEADPVRRYFEMSIPILEKIAPWAFVAAIGIALLAIIILPGALKG